jgi:hypothetical protein
MRAKSSGAYARRSLVSEEYKQKEATATRFHILADSPSATKRRCASPPYPQPPSSS